MKLKMFFLFLYPFFIFQQTVTIKEFRKTGLGVHWDQSGSNRILYDMKGKDKYYDLYSTLPDGTQDTCITCNSKFLPNKHIANGSWHPSGKWFTAVVEKATHKGPQWESLPGIGSFCDIWIISDDGKKGFKLIEEPNDNDHGIICPRFSNDGKKISWTERKKNVNILDPKRHFGFWVIKIADFYFGADSVPVVKNIKTLEPGPDSFYECYGFSPDDKQLIFCSSIGEKSAWTQQIYTMDTTGANLKKLTETVYNEHACYTPDGKKIVWMSNQDNKNKGTDWWIMNADGTEKKRITFFNDPKNKQYEGHARWAGLITFSPDGKTFVGGVQLSLVTQEGKVVMGTLEN
ncbi:MAG: PD40 domain-containing protein [Bacteroidia bacterium]|nr:PD40 domain-containing protein [Bacteroidia bacterium]